MAIVAIHVLDFVCEVQKSLQRLAQFRRLSLLIFDRIAKALHGVVVRPAISVLVLEVPPDLEYQLYVLADVKPRIYRLVQLRQRGFFFCFSHYQSSLFSGCFAYTGTWFHPMRDYSATTPHRGVPLWW